MKSLLFTFFIYLMASTASAETEFEYQLFANKTPPYGMLFSTLGNSKGLVIELLERAVIHSNLKVKNSPPDVPWSEAQHQGEATANSLIAPFARTPARENKFLWISVLLNEKLFTFTKKEVHPVNSFEDLKKVATVGVTAGSASESRMSEMGIKHTSCASDLICFQKLAGGELDVILSQGFIADEHLAKLGPSADKIVRGKALMDLPLWVATSRLTSLPALLKARVAIEKFKATAEYSAILKKYQSPRSP